MRAIVLFISLLLAACRPAVMSVGTATPPSFITRQQAIANALGITSSSAPEISGAQVPPVNIQAEQTTLAQAVQRMNSRGGLPKGYAPDLPVWYVTMDGLWANEVQAPGVTATQVPYHHYFLILDAVTGMAIETALRP